MIHLSALRPLDFGKGNGLIPAVVQHWKNKQVLMIGYMNRESLAETCASGEVVFFSRSRQTRWKKGERSGNRLIVKSIFADCDHDAVLVLAEPLGPVCHLGTKSCFEPRASESRSMPPQYDPGTLENLAAIVRSRLKEPPENSYTSKLLNMGQSRVAQKVGEEAVELAIAAQSDDGDRIASEAADLLYHFTVLLECKGITLDKVKSVLESRQKPAKHMQ
jgi:phosphoribosyl-ATP pyrophosphohydrolase/phosphoribosyl-AMP cyclohydrolase